MLKIAPKLTPAILALALAAAFPLAQAGGSGASDAKAGNTGAAVTESGATGSTTSAADTSGTSMTSGASSTVSADTANDDAAIQNLVAASEALREGIQRLADSPPGERRSEAIRESNEALMQVQGAIAALPPQLRDADADEPAYTDAMDKLKQASDRLHAAAQALANQPPGAGRNDAVQEVNQALLETNEAMLTGMQLSAAGSAGEQTTGSSATEASTGASADTSGAGGSATATGRPGANTVDLADDDAASTGNGTGSNSIGTGGTEAGGSASDSTSTSK